MKKSRPLDDEIGGVVMGEATRAEKRKPTFDGKRLIGPLTPRDRVLWGRLLRKCRARATLWARQREGSVAS